MIDAVRTRRNTALLIELSLLAALVSCSWFMASSAYLKAEPQLIGNAIMVDLTFTAVSELESHIEQLLRPPTAYLHLHYAKYGCFACRVDRA